MEDSNNVDAKFRLITQRIPLDHVYGEDILKEALSSKDGRVRGLWG